MPKMKILIADDESDLLAELKPLLERSGYDILTAVDGALALEISAREKFDLIILDMLMPKMDGRAVLQALRNKNDWTPVILLTKVNTPADRVLSLQAGADDYLNKPFDPLELLARIQAILRRTRQGDRSLTGARTLRSGKLRLDRQTRQAALDGRPLNLTARALGVLEYLMLHPMEIVPRERLLDEVWGWSYALETRAVDTRIAEIRKSLGDDSDKPVYIETVIGQGYRFLGGVQEES
jgi:DNA-binding response OmpR family regulator